LKHILKEKNDCFIVKNKIETFLGTDYQSVPKVCKDNSHDNICLRVLQFIIFCKIKISSKGKL